MLVVSQFVSAGAYLCVNNADVTAKFWERFPSENQNKSFENISAVLKRFSAPKLAYSLLLAF